MLSSCQEFAAPNWLRSCSITITLGKNTERPNHFAALSFFSRGRRENYWRRWRFCLQEWQRLASGAEINVDRGGLFQHCRGTLQTTRDRIEFFSTDTDLFLPQQKSQRWNHSAERLQHNHCLEGHIKTSRDKNTAHFNGHFNQIQRPVRFPMIRCTSYDQLTFYPFFKPLAVPQSKQDSVSREREREEKRFSCQKTTRHQGSNWTEW